MIILGIHFGHDASVSVVKNGVVLNCIERERLTRAKHAIGITVNEVEKSLEDAGISVAEVDYCAVTSTQRIEYLFPEPDELSFELSPMAPHAKFCSLTDSSDPPNEAFGGSEYVREIIRSGRVHPYVKRLSPEFLDNLETMASVPAIDDFIVAEEWRVPARLRQIPEIDFQAILGDHGRLGMYLPITATVKGRKIPGFMVSHHYAHAAYAFYGTNFEEAAILSHDGSLPETSYWGGMYYYGENTRLYPVAPHCLSAGNLYERIAFLLNLGYDTGAGKLMGLAPWGKPRFFDQRFVGNWHDGKHAPAAEGPLPDGAQIPDWIDDERHPLLYRWLHHCLTTAGSLSYDFGPLGDTEQILAPINTDLAASTQKLLEEILITAAEVQFEIQEKLGRPTKNLCLTGGVALNCPANSIIHQRSPFSNVSVLPAVSDGGLSIGAAFSICHNIFDIPRVQRTLDAGECAYLGYDYNPNLTERAISLVSDKIIAERPADIHKDAAEKLADDAVIAWFEGRSETGPRALGHRSILAHPGHKENWERVNRIKGRETWRPFAPVVLEENADDYFEGAPMPSPFMLFTAQVKNPDAIPAITHIDGSSRIQTVKKSDGDYYRVLKSFKELTGLGVLMNTSFNGPGEPIVETPENALSMFLLSDLDFLYLNGWKISKRGEPAH